MNDTITKEQAEKAARILARRFRKPPKPRRSRVADLHPVIEFMFDEMEHLKVTDVELQIKTGLSCNVLSKWRNGVSPRLTTLEPVLNALGYRLAAVPLPETFDDDTKP